MRILLILLALAWWPAAASGQTVPDLSPTAIPYAAEMTLTHSVPLVCAQAGSGPSPFNAPDWTSENCSGGGGWTYTHDALDLVTCNAAIADMVAMQLAWERVAQIKAGLTPVVFDYQGACQCKGGGTTGC